jgi:hypothetical protein
MGKPNQTVRIGDQLLEYRLTDNDKTLEFDLPQGKYSFKAWNWGEKNRVLDQCISFDAHSNEFLLDVAHFNELVLLTTLKSANLNGQQLKIDLATIRNLEAAMGDLLLDICQWVNRLDQNQPNKAGTDEITEHEAPQGKKIITAGEYLFKLRGWAWGEKNRTLSLSTIFNKNGNEVKVSYKEFSERMLCATLEEISIKDERLPITREYVQQLDARLGDILFEAAQEINEISWGEKKN